MTQHRPSQQDDALHAAHWDAVEEATELLLEGRLQEAIEELQRVLREDPDNEYAYFFLGQAHFEQERWDKALKAYVEALARAPRFLGAMIGAGHCLLRLNRPEQAVRMARQTLLAQPEDPDALYLLGHALLALGRLREAEEAFERFLATRPELEVATEVQALLAQIRAQRASGGDDRRGEEP